MSKPNWWNEDKLIRIRFAVDETGWAIDVGDKMFRLANNPIAGMTGKIEPNVAQWGDLVSIENNEIVLVKKYEGS